MCEYVYEWVTKMKLLWLSPVKLLLLIGYLLSFVVLVSYNLYSGMISQGDVLTFLGCHFPLISHISRIHILG